MRLAGLVARLRALTLRSRAEREMEEELRYHLDAEAARHVAAGMSPAAAEQAARRAFGNPSHHKDEMRDAAWGGLRWLEHVAQDVRFAIRSFRRYPTFAITVVATIALALGLNTTAFTIFNAYVLRPIAVRDPYSLYQVGFHDAHGRGRALTLDDYESLREARVAGGTVAGGQVAGRSESFAYHFLFTRIEQRATFGALATGNVFQVLGAGTHLGRTLLPEDAAPGSASAVMVLSYDAWRSRFGADSGIIGRMVRVRGVPLQVVGVLAKSFQGIGSLPPDFWAPLPLAPELGRGASAPLRVVLRLGPGESEDAARAMLGTWAAQRVAAMKDTSGVGGAELLSLANAMPSNSYETYLMFIPIFVAFALVMLIACANVANMMLARALARQREIGIRLALGAERARLIRQLLTEAVMLALPAALAGFLLSRWTIDAGVRTMFASLPASFVPYMRVIPLAPDLRVFVFLLIAAVAAALLFGLAPAIQATRPNIVQASRGDFDTAFRPGRMRSALLVAQITVCALLLITTGLLLRGAATARNIKTGMVTQNVVQISPDARSREMTVKQLREHALVEELAGSSFQTLDGSLPTIAQRYSTDARTEQVAYGFVTANWFGTLGIPVLRGRTFTADEERAGAQVAVVSAETAARLWPGQDPLGQVLRIAVEVPAGSRLTRVRLARVVGVTGNTVTGWIGTGLQRLVAYYPGRAEDAGFHLLARVRGNEVLARQRLDDDIDAAAASSPIEDIHTLNEYLAVQRYPFQAFSWVSSAIGAIALLLTIAGIYGVLSYLVEQRTREIGVRMALGAGVRGVVGLVLRQTTVFALSGAAIGAVLALGVSRLFEETFWIVNMYDALGYAGGVVVVFAAALAASLAPARRAAKVDPMEALRAE